MRYRIERDALGEMKIPLDAYYGISTLRNKEMFEITYERVHKQMIKSLAIVKKAAALANHDAGNLNLKKMNAIISACDEVINGKYQNQFITDPLQGGGGSGINMNMNEVIANRANEKLGGRLGEYEFIHPLKDVNLSQSSNDVIPTAAKHATIVLCKQLLVEIKKLIKSFEDKAKENKNILKIGRTHLQDSMPISFGEEFGAMASSLKRDYNRLINTLNDLYEVNLGSATIGTLAYVNETYLAKVIEHFNEETECNFYLPENILDISRNIDSFVSVSHSLKILALNISKISSDIRLMCSGPQSGFNEIMVPQFQSEIADLMPGKINPIIPEAVNQIAFQVIGKVETISYASEHGQLEFNVFGTIVYPNLFDSIEYLTRGIYLLRTTTIEPMKVNLEKVSHDVENSSGMILGLLPTLGYDKCQEIVKTCYETGKTIREVVLERKLLTKTQLDKLLSINNIVKKTHRKKSSNQ